MAKETNEKRQPNISEPEENKQAFDEVMDDFDPLNEDTDVINPAKKVKMKGDTSVLKERIATAEHDAATVDLTEGADNEFNNDASAEQDGYGIGMKGKKTKATAPPEPPPVNPEFASLDEEDQDEGSAVLAEVIVESYAGLKKKAPELVKIRKRKIDKLHKNGEIDKYALIPPSRLSPNGSITVERVVEQFNETLDRKDTFDTSPEFKEKAKYLLSKILKRKGAGMTPEQELMTMFAFDIVQTSFGIFQMGKERKEFIDKLTEVSHDIKKMAPTQPVQPNVPPQQAAPINADIVTPKPQPKQQPAQTSTVQDIVELAKDTEKKKRGRPKKEDKVA